MYRFHNQASSITSKSPETTHFRTNALFLNYYTSKILVLTFLQMCQKRPKNDGQIKKLSNFCKKLHHKINFSQHFMFPQVKTQLSLSQNNFLVIGTHWTVA